MKPDLVATGITLEVYTVDPTTGERTPRESVDTTPTDWPLTGGWPLCTCPSPRCPSRTARGGGK